MDTGSEQLERILILCVDDMFQARDYLMSKLPGAQFLPLNSQNPTAFKVILRNGICLSIAVPLNYNSVSQFFHSPTYEIALFDKVQKKIIYNPNFGYKDVLRFDGLNNLRDELERLSNLRV